MVRRLGFARTVFYTSKGTLSRCLNPFFRAASMRRGPIGDPSAMNTPEGVSGRPCINDFCSGKFAPFGNEGFSSCLPRVPFGHPGLFKLNPSGVFCLPGFFVLRGDASSRGFSFSGLFIVPGFRFSGQLILRGFLSSGAFGPPDPAPPLRKTGQHGMIPMHARNKRRQSLSSPRGSA
jgi:hypothetical protein